MMSHYLLTNKLRDCSHTLPDACKLYVKHNISSTVIILSNIFKRRERSNKLWVSAHQSKIEATFLRIFSISQIRCYSLRHCFISLIQFCYKLHMWWPIWAQYGAQSAHICICMLWSWLPTFCVTRHNSRSSLNHTCRSKTIDFYSLFAIIHFNEFNLSLSLSFFANVTQNLKLPYCSSFPSFNFFTISLDKIQRTCNVNGCDLASFLQLLSRRCKLASP